MTGNGIGLGTVLGLIFVTLKLCGVIDWSWLWVTVPFWGFFALLGIIVGGGALAILIGHGLEKAWRKLKRGY